MANPYSPILKALAGIGIGTGKGSNKFKAKLTQYLKNNITSTEDIPALTQHIKDKFNAARTGGTHEDGRFAGIMSYEELGRKIWDKGSIRPQITLKRTPEQEKYKSLKSLSKKYRDKVERESQRIRETIGTEYADGLVISSKYGNSTPSIVNDNVRDFVFNDKVASGSYLESIKSYGQKAIDRELADQKSLVEQMSSGREKASRSQKQKHREKLQQIRDLPNTGENLRQMESTSNDKIYKPYWNDEARVRSLERSHASALKQLDEQGTIVDSKNLFSKLNNDETAKAQLQRYNPELYNKLGFGTKTLEEDLAEQEAYQASYNIKKDIKKTIATTSLEDAQKQIGADAYMREMSGEAGIEDIKFAQDYMAEHESARAGYESAKAQAAINKQIEQKQIQSKAMAGLDEDTKKEIAKGGLGHFMVNGELNEAKITQNVSRNTDRSNSWISGGAYNNAVTHRGKSITEYGNTRLKEIENDSSLDAIQKEQEKIKLQLDIKNQTEQGPGIADYIFGNKVHTGAIGVAALTATYGVAFGGHKSNAELYGSPF